MVIKSHYHRFSACQIDLKYPGDWSVSVNKEINYRKGGISFIPPGRKGRIYIFWGPLTEARGFKSAKEHAEAAFKQVTKESRFAGGRTALIDTASRKLNTHDSYTCQLISHRVRPGPFPPFMRGGMPEEVQATYLHCDKSGRYFVLVVEIDSDEQGKEKIVNGLLETFNCHPEE